MVKVLQEVSRLLNCPLDRETLSVAIQLLESGANPEALAAVITELQNEATRLKSAR
jgi:mitotic-spindle organizing protein 1